MHDDRGGPGQLRREELAPAAEFIRQGFRLRGATGGDGDGDAGPLEGQTGRPGSAAGADHQARLAGEGQLRPGGGLAQGLGDGRDVRVLRAPPAAFAHQRVGGSGRPAGLVAGNGGGQGGGLVGRGDGKAAEVLVVRQLQEGGQVAALEGQVERIKMRRLEGHALDKGREGMGQGLAEDAVDGRARGGSARRPQAEELVGGQLPRSRGLGRGQPRCGQLRRGLARYGRTGPGAGRGVGEGRAEDGCQDARERAGVAGGKGDQAAPPFAQEAQDAQAVFGGGRLGHELQGVTLVQHLLHLRQAAAQEIGVGGHVCGGAATPLAARAARFIGARSIAARSVRAGGGPQRLVA